MRTGVHFSNFTLTGGAAALPKTLTESAQVADQSGMAKFTVMDHWFQIPPIGDAERDMHEAYTTLGFVAAVTEKVQIGVLATGVTYRYPGLLAKTVTTLDVLSGGRAMLGIGAAWFEREHLGLGAAFPALGIRFELLEEALQICLQMWSDNDGAYDGKHNQLAETLCHPAPIQSPHPPIMIAGGGEKKTLRMVAQYGNACNVFGSPEEVKHKFDILRGHCDDLGTDYEAIEKTVLGPFDPVGDPDGFLAQAEAFAAVGVEHIHLSLRGEDAVGYITDYAEKVLPKLADIGS